MVRKRFLSITAVRAGKTMSVDALFYLQSYVAWIFGSTINGMPRLMKLFYSSRIRGELGEEVHVDS